MRDGSLLAERDPAPHWLRSLAVLAGLVAGCLGVAALGGLITSTSVETWYPNLAKPAFTPPDGVFGPVWTTLYVAMAVAAWRVWRQRGLAGARGALVLFTVQLVLNLLWSVLFFGLRWPAVALMEIVVLGGVIAATTRAFWSIDRWAGWLMLPYLAWVAFAVALNGSIWWLN